MFRDRFMLAGGPKNHSGARPVGTWCHRAVWPDLIAVSAHTSIFTPRAVKLRNRGPFDALTELVVEPVTEAVIRRLAAP